MVVNLKAKKKLVARTVGVGVNRIKFDSEHLDDVTDAITRGNMRGLVSSDVVKIKPKSGTSRGRAKFKRSQKHKRGIKQGSKKGRKGARSGKKEVYVKKVRALRRRLKVAKDKNEIDNKSFWSIYKQVGGNQVRSLAHLRSLMQESKSSQ